MLKPKSISERQRDRDKRRQRDIEIETSYEVCFNDNYSITTVLRICGHTLQTGEKVQPKCQNRAEMILNFLKTHFEEERE